MLMGKKARENFCKNVLKDEGKPSDDTVLGRYGPRAGFFVRPAITAICIRDMNMLETTENMMSVVDLA